MPSSLLHFGDYFLEQRESVIRRGGNAAAVGRFLDLPAVVSHHGIEDGRIEA
jgi:hypothetical protein